MPPPAAAMATRVCVLTSSYDGSASDMKAFESHLIQTPQHYFSADDLEYQFTLVPVQKATAYRQIRQLVQSGDFDVFYNQCDAAIDEDRAGIEVVEALEAFRVPFTGAASKYYELSKPTMKLVAHHCGIRTARHAVLVKGDDVATVCASLRFPLIIKHISGYSSVGMDKSCKVATMAQLVDRVRQFIAEFQFALVEEFIAGDEATVLVCADETQPEGVRVFHPVQVTFPSGEDFKHFQLKWEAYEGMEWRRVADADPALPEMLQVTRRAFREMMGGIGYGRVDVRIDRANGDQVVFLEINPNCGVMYPYGDEGSADWILRLSPDFKQREFAVLQIREALARHARERPLYTPAYDPVRNYHLQASEDIQPGTVIFSDEGQPMRLWSNAYLAAGGGPGIVALPQPTLSNGHGAVKSVPVVSVAGSRVWPLDPRRGYCIGWGGADPLAWRCITHSTTPNMGPSADGTLRAVALRFIAKSEELTMDYDVLRSGTHVPPFHIQLQPQLQ